MSTSGVALEGIDAELARQAVTALLVVEPGRWLRLTAATASAAGRE
jgi:hypothetical protein